MPSLPWFSSPSIPGVPNQAVSKHLFTNRRLL
jgi:hypothetical protein